VSLLNSRELTPASNPKFRGQRNGKIALCYSLRGSEESLTMSNPLRMPPDFRAEAMKAAVKRISGEKSMKDPDKNPLDSLIDPKDGTNELPAA